MSILALDLGKQTGWAIFTDGVIQSGSESFHGSSSNKGHFLNFRNWLNSLEHKFTEVYFEEVRRHLGTCAAHCYGGFLAFLIAWCEEKNIFYEGVSVKTIKRFITGKGNASKSDVIEAVREKGFSPQDDNEADALALIFYITNLNGSNSMNNGFYTKKTE